MCSVCEKLLRKEKLLKKEKKKSFHPVFVCVHVCVRTVRGRLELLILLALD